MTPQNIERVFGRGRLKMVTGEHVEVFREEALPGERRRYTKRFLSSMGADFRHWTEREWRILARLVGHGIGPVPDVVQFDRGAGGRSALVQTYDAGVTVDHWATLLPVQRDGQVLRHVFEDCAHWWALARHCLIALDAIHELQLVHLDLKADNVCIPCGPSDFDPGRPGQTLHPQFEQIALIDFAFSLVSGEPLQTALPIGHQADYDYQSPRLLHALEAGRRGNLLPTRQLDWRCDVFSLAAMLRRYLPGRDSGHSGGWNDQRLASALSLVRRLVEAHDRSAPAQRPHKELIELTSRALRDRELASSLARGWQLARDANVAADATPTPVTRIALPVGAAFAREVGVMPEPAAAAVAALARSGRARRLMWVSGVVAATAVGVPLIGEAWLKLHEVRLADAGSRADRAVAPRTEIDAGSRADRAVAAATEILARAPVEARPAAVAEVAPTASSPAAASAPASAAPLAAEAAAPSVSAAAPVAVGAPAASAATAPASAAPSTPAEAASAPAAQPTNATAVVAAAPPVAARATPATPAAAQGARAAPKPRPKAVLAQKTTPSATLAAAARATAALTARVTAKPIPAEPAVHETVSVAPRATVGPAPPFAPAAGVHGHAAVAPPSPPVQVASSTPSPAPSPASPSASLPPVLTPVPVQVPAPAPPRAASVPALPDDFGMRANVLINEHLPRLAQQAERRVLRALHVAAQAENPWQHDEVAAAARSVRFSGDEALPAIAAASGDARALNEAADAAFWNGRNPQQALSLQSRAFGANPNDSVVAGNLAFYYLKQRPARADAARQLALHALTTPDPRFPQGRVEDWTYFAIASALTGRERDARNAFFVTLALSPSIDRQCRSALAAVASHGERLRAPTEAMLARIRSWGRSQESSFCRWPPSWWTAGFRAP